MSTRPTRVRRLAMCTILSIVTSLQMFGCASTSQPKDTSTTMSKPSSSSDVVKEFFAAFGKGNAEGIVATFHPEAEIVAVRRAVRNEGEIYGTYSGKEGVKVFVTVLASAFDTQAFSVDSVVGEGNVAFASGRFTHKLKATGKLFSSDWALKCIVEDGKIREYHFFEDSAAFGEANH